MTIFKTDKWEFNTTNQQISFSDGEVKTIPRRISLLLEVLMEKAGDTISHDELLQKV